MICQTFIQSTRHTAYDSAKGHLRKAIAAPDQVHLTSVAVFNINTSSYHVLDFLSCPRRVFIEGKVWAYCWPWHSIDIVLLEVTIYAC